VTTISRLPSVGFPFDITQRNIRNSAAQVQNRSLVIFMDLAALSLTTTSSLISAIQIMLFTRNNYHLKGLNALTNKSNMMHPVKDSWGTEACEVSDGYKRTSYSDP
jgi:hypothetical protein